MPSSFGMSLEIGISNQMYKKKKEFWILIFTVKIFLNFADADTVKIEIM